MRGKRALSICTALFIVLLAIVGCGKKEDLTGKWIYTEEGTGKTATMELFSDGTGVYTEEDWLSYSCTWSTENGKFKLEIDTGIFGKISQTAEYKLDGDKLVFTDDGESDTYYRE